MYRYSVNLSIAYYSRRNSIAGANVKPVFVITCAHGIDLFPDEIYFTLFICATSFIFFALYCASIKPHLSTTTLEWNPPLKHFTSLIHQRPYLIWIYSYHSRIASATSSKKYRKFSLTHFRRAMQIAYYPSGIQIGCYFKMCANLYRWFY